MQGPTAPIRMLLDFDQLERVSSASFALELLVALLLWAVLLAVVQRDWRRFSRGIADLRGHWRDLKEGLAACRRALRALAVLLACSFVSWATWTLFGRWSEQAYASELEDWLTLFDGSAAAFSAAAGLRPASSPLMPLLAASTTACSVLLAWVIVVAGRCVGWDTFMVSLRLLPDSMLVALFIDRAALAAAGEPVVPCCIGRLEIVPLLVAVVLADAIVLKWVALELSERSAELRPGWFRICQQASSGLWPAVLLCLLAGMYRYTGWLISMASPLAHARLLGLLYRLAEYNCLFGPVLLAGPAVLAVAKPVRIDTFLRQWLLLCRYAGGQLAAWTIYAVAAQWAVSVPCYWLFASMEPLPWSIIGMSSYAAYANLIVAFCLLGVLVRIAGRHLRESRESVQVPQRSPLL